MRIAFGAIDLLLGALVLIGVLRERMAPGPNILLVIPAGIALVVSCLLVNLLSERLRSRISRSGKPALPTLISLPMALVRPLRKRSRPQLRRAEGLAGMAVDLAIGLIAVALFLLFNGTERRLGDLGAVAAIAIGGSAGSASLRLRHSMAAGSRVGCWNTLSMTKRMPFESPV